MAANVETMFYVREKPWHGLGVEVQEALNSADALKLVLSLTAIRSCRIRMLSALPMS